MLDVRSSSFWTVMLNSVLKICLNIGWVGGLEKLQKHDCVIYEWSLVQVEEARRFIDAMFAAAFPPAVAVFAPATTTLIKVNNSYLSSIQKFNCNFFCSEDYGVKKCRISSNFWFIEIEFTAHYINSFIWCIMIDSIVSKVIDSSVFFLVTQKFSTTV